MSIPESVVRAPRLDTYTQTDESPPIYQEQFGAAQKTANFVRITDNIVSLVGVERVQTGRIKGASNKLEAAYEIKVSYCNGNIQCFRFPFTTAMPKNEQEEANARKLRDRDLQIITRALVPQQDSNKS